MMRMMQSTGGVNFPEIKEREVIGGKDSVVLAAGGFE